MEIPGNFPRKKVSNGSLCHIRTSDTGPRTDTYQAAWKSLWPNDRNRMTVHIKEVSLVTDNENWHLPVGTRTLAPCGQQRIGHGIPGVKNCEEY